MSLVPCEYWLIKCYVHILCGVLFTYTLPCADIWRERLQQRVPRGEAHERCQDIHGQYTASVR